MFWERNGSINARYLRHGGIALVAATLLSTIGAPVLAGQNAAPPAHATKPAAKPAPADPNPLATGPQSILTLMRISTAALKLRLGRPLQFAPDTFDPKGGVYSFRVQDDTYIVVVDNGHVTNVDLTFGRARATSEQVLADAGINMHGCRQTKSSVYAPDDKYTV